MITQRATLSPSVVVVGGGPAGLSAAIELKKLGVGSVLVVDRELEAGGIPRMSHHTGFGIRDLRRVLTGPDYAARLVRDARDWGTEIRTSTMVTHWADPADGFALLVTSPAGRLRIEPAAVILATGARERPRSARLVPGDRPAGVMTTGQLQNLVHSTRTSESIGLVAVVVGSEQISWSAVLTLRHAGCTTVLMTSEASRSEAYAAFAVPGRTLLRTPVSHGSRVVRIIGRDRVEAVELIQLDSGRRRIVECDTVVFTGDWIPDNEIARARGLEMDPGSKGPIVDAALRTSVEGIFAAGNLVHPVDTADVAALDGRHVAAQVADFLDGRLRSTDCVRLVAGSGLEWVAPGILRAGDPPAARGRLLLWPMTYRRVARLTARQGSRVVGRKVLPWPAAPGRILRVPWSLLAGVEISAGDVILEIG